MPKASKQNVEENPKLPPHLEAFELFKKKVEEVEQTSFGDFLKKAQNKKKS